MSNVPKLASPVLSKTNRQLAREFAYRLLEQGYTLIACYILICAIWQAGPRETRYLLAYMRKPHRTAYFAI